MASSLQPVHEGDTVWIASPPSWVRARGADYSGVLASFQGAVGIYSAQTQTFLPTADALSVEQARLHVASSALDQVLAHDFSMHWSEVYFTKLLIYLAPSHAAKPDAPFDMEACARAHAALWGMNATGTTPVEAKDVIGFGVAPARRVIEATRARDGEVPEKLRRLLSAIQRNVKRDARRTVAKRPPLRRKP